MSSGTPHILVLGGGFGGLSVATEIRKRLPPSRAKITVIDKKDWFMVGFAKLWIIRGTRTFEESVGSLHRLTRNGISFVKAEIEVIDPEKREVATSQGGFTYDYLVVAMGARLAPQKIPGLVENGLNLYDHDHLETIREKLTDITSGSVAIAIMGMPYKCPPAPFEAGLLVDSLLREAGTRDTVQIHLYSPAPLTLPAAGPAVSRKVLEMVQAEGIEFHPSCRVRSVRRNRMEFEEGGADFELLLSIPPHIAPQVIYDAGLAEEGGFITINRDCQTPYGRVYAIGDVTSMPAGGSMAVPKAGVFAEGQGLTVARSIVAGIESRQEESIFDGRGACFLESGRGTASLVEVDMFSGDRPTTKLTAASRDTLEEKLAFERDRLSRWLG